MNWANYFSNPFSITIKKFLYEILKDRYLENEKFIERMCNDLRLKEDIENFVKLLNDAYQMGFLLSVEQHKEALNKLGLQVNLVDPTISEKDKIFQSEKSG
jgi:hypothetical protein